uniref:Tegument protein UL51 homolog n=1 Tax=Mastomys natalensis cytomegalovirus 1 TaxID=2973541 RepID=A0A9Y1N9R4_9BETA|nr:tegument protein UL51 [Mastomys natalensis cytomegalovirus 1]WEG68928.1 tegument protein UL51 [Mastomys natalensis cytomegalovirus 1]WEG71156.1 tegument protein UL51 [Mastomys natalensis cytomegalovirus 1]
MTEPADGSPPGCLKRLLDFALCRRTIHGGSEYIVLKSSEDVDVAELEVFLRENFENLGISATDLTEIDREAEVTRHLLRLLPVYKRCVRRHTKLDRLLANQCRPHLRAAAEIECQKSKKVMETLDVVILKLLVGQFSLSDDDSVERLLEKFSVDQTTLCEVGKIVRLIDMDRENTKRLVSHGDSESDMGLDPILYELENAPSVPDSVPGSEADGLAGDPVGLVKVERSVGQRAAADGDDRRPKVTTV